jgi:hypothetical protein
MHKVELLMLRPKLNIRTLALMVKMSNPGLLLWGELKVCCVAEDIDQRDTVLATEEALGSTT